MPLLTRSLRVSSAAGELTRFLTGDEFIEQGRALVARFIVHWQKRGELGVFDAEVVAELFVRLTMSFISNPRGALPLADAAAAKEFARRFLAPLLSRTRAQVGHPPATAWGAPDKPPTSAAQRDQERHRFATFAGEPLSARRVLGHVLLLGATSHPVARSGRLSLRAGLLSR
ncbi:hypothetical protein ACWEKR_11430 [Nocardia sp. NPDC004573]